MFLRKSFYQVLLLVMFTSLITACSSAGGPKQIAAAPRLTPIAEFPGNASIIYQAYLELQVVDVDASATRAQDLAQSYGGYLTNSQSWLVDGLTVRTLELLVPSAGFDRLRLALLQLGVLVSETTSGRLVEMPPARQPYSSITLHLRPQTRAAWQPLQPPNTVSLWSPGRTFQRAFAVFLAIFGFLADMIIWVLVVVGPFALIFLIAWKAARRIR